MTAADGFVKFMDEASIDCIVAQPGQGAWKSAMDLLTKLEQDLNALRDRDRNHMDGTIHQAVGYLNDVRQIGSDGDMPAARRKLSFLLVRTGKKEIVMKFEYLVASLLSTNSDRDIAKLNPFIDERKTHFVYDLAVSAILHSSRVSQINQALDLLRDVMKYLNKINVPKSSITTQQAVKTLSLLQQRLAASLLSKRHFVHATNTPNGVAFSFDPRYLVFEFSQEILIRKSQV